MEFELEKYHGTKSRYTCPACGARASFVRYKDERGEYLSETVGRCNRESKCGYHKKPKDFFAENEMPAAGRKKQAGKSKTLAGCISTSSSGSQSVREAAGVLKKPDYIERGFLLRTLTNYERNPFIRFLLDLFPENAETVEKSVKDYLIGTTGGGKTVFWQIDRLRRVRTGKIIAYDARSGRRRKDVFPNWIHSELKKSGRLKADFNLQQCFFGEHLLGVEKEKPAAIVEAEKTAVIASVCFPGFVWLAAGAKRNLNAERLTRLGPRKIILYPDTDAFDQWREIARASQARGLNIAVSSLIETRASLEQKRSGYDLADYLIEEQTRINEHNAFADSYNSKLEKVLRDENLFLEFNRALDAQKANLITSNGFSEADAERQISDFGNMREIVFRITGEQKPT